jgi:hypothetical protein
VIEGCARGVADEGLYEYANKNCRAKQGAGAGDPDARAREHEHGIAAALDARGGRGGLAGGVIGQYLLFGAYDEDKDGDEIWLARAVADERPGGRCCKQVSKRTLLHRDESRSTAFSVGDWAIAVDWLERTGSDPERHTLGPSDGVVCFVNSTELRHIVARAGSSRGPTGKRGEVVLSRKEEADAQDWCR